MTLRVKICGVTRAEDARAAVDAGASAIGVVLWPGSPRAISVERAAKILAEVPADVMKVGVFVDQPRRFIEQAARAAELDAIQLHGKENPEAFDMTTLVLKAVPVGAHFDVAMLQSLPGHVLPLLDAADDVRHGGTGKTIDWTSAAAASSVRKIVLAGGLTPANVREAIRVVQPFAIDVSSGVEAAPGRKSAALIRKLFDAVSAEAGAPGRGPWL